MNVSKPSAHAMIRNLCEMQLAEKEHYGIVYLTQAGRKAAALYETCYEPLFARMQDVLALDGDACRPGGAGRSGSGARPARGAVPPAGLKKRPEILKGDTFP